MKNGNIVKSVNRESVENNRNSSEYIKLCLDWIELIHCEEDSVKRTAQCIEMVKRLQVIFGTWSGLQKESIAKILEAFCATIMETCTSITSTQNTELQKWIQSKAVGEKLVEAMECGNHSSLEKQVYTTILLTGFRGRLCLADELELQMIMRGLEV
jgi:hypothetical protein